MNTRTLELEELIRTLAASEAKLRSENRALRAALLAASVALTADGNHQAARKARAAYYQKGEK
jgi:hypothetical protein